MTEKLISAEINISRVKFLSLLIVYKLITLDIPVEYDLLTSGFL